jgi:hypothetical protein
MSSNFESLAQQAERIRIPRDGTKLLDQNEYFDAYDKIEELIDSLENQELGERYLPIADLFWHLPDALSAKLANRMIEDHLLEKDAWSEIYLWSWAAVRKQGEHNFASRVYHAIALQALGEGPRAREILRDCMESAGEASGHAMRLIFGPAPETRTNYGLLDWKNAPPNPFSELEATWLHDPRVANVEKESRENLGFAAKEKVQRLALDSSGLVSHLLGVVARLPEDPEVRQIALLGGLRAYLSIWEFDNSSDLLQLAKESLQEGSTGSTVRALGFLALATLYQDDEAYILYIEELKKIGYVDQAIGVALAADVRHVPGAGELLAKLMSM